MKKIVVLIFWSCVFTQLFTLQSTLHVDAAQLTSAQQKLQKEYDRINHISYIKVRKNKFLHIESCDMNPIRKANVRVDVGYGNRIAWAYTDQYARVVRLETKEITLQKKEEGLVYPNNTLNGRYCPKQAQVPGTAGAYYDAGHVLADSLGGAANAYNITPQVSVLNQQGQQIQMEDKIRNLIKKGKRVTDFVAFITYSDSKTNIPKWYKYIYKIDGVPYGHTFANK